MEERSFGAAWAATLGFIRANTAVLLPVVGLFLFLPQLLFQFFTQDLLPGKGVPDGAELRVALLFAVLLAGSVLGQIVLTRLVLAPSGGATAGDALSASIGLFLPVLAATIIQSLAVGLGLLFLVVPGLYVLARLVFTLPVIADGERDPIEALKRSWALTADNGFRLLGYVLALFLGFVIISLLLGGVGAAIGVVSTVAAGGARPGWGIGRWLFEMLSSGTGAVLGMTYIVFIAMLYRAFVRSSRNG